MKNELRLQLKRVHKGIRTDVNTGPRFDFPSDCIRSEGGGGGGSVGCAEFTFTYYRNIGSVK